MEGPRALQGGLEVTETSTHGGAPPRTPPLTPVLTANWDQPDSFTRAGYERTGGYKAIGKALAVQPDDVIELVDRLVTRRVVDVD